MTKAAELAKMGEVLTNSQIGGRRNIVINGAMQVAQRGTSATGKGDADGYFTCDRWNIDVGVSTSASAGRFTMSQDSSAPVGFANSLKLACTTADTSVASGERLQLQQKIEGQDLQAFAKGTSDAKPFSVSFFVKGNASATYVCELFDLDNNRQCSKTFNVTTSFTRVELLFPADTTGTFDDDNEASLMINIFLHAGSGRTSGTLNSSAFAAVATTDRAGGISSFFDSTDRTFFITGVQLEVGSQATPFEHRSFGEEQRLCHRYFQRLGGQSYHPFAIVAGQNATLSRSVQHLLTPMRAIPTFTSEGSFLVEGTSAQAVSSFSIDIGTKEVMMMNVNSSSTHGEDGSAGRFFGDSGTSAFIRFDAEL